MEYPFLENLKLNNNFSILCERIQGFQNLEPKWNYGYSESVKLETIQYVIHLLSYISLSCNDFDNLKINAFPNSDGGITISLGNKDEFIELIVNSDLTSDIIYEKGIGVEYEIMDEVCDIPKNNFDHIIYYLYKLCNLSEPSILSTTTMKINKDLSAVFSKTTMEEYQYLTRPVPSLKVEEYVYTY